MPLLQRSNFEGPGYVLVSRTLPLLSSPELLWGGGGRGRVAAIRERPLSREDAKHRSTPTSDTGNLVEQRSPLVVRTPRYTGYLDRGISQAGRSQDRFAHD